VPKARPIVRSAKNHWLGQYGAEPIILRHHFGNFVHQRVNYQRRLQFPVLIFVILLPSKWLFSFFVLCIKLSKLLIDFLISFEVDSAVSL